MDEQAVGSSAPPSRARALSKGRSNDLPLKLTMSSHARFARILSRRSARSAENPRDQPLDDPQRSAPDPGDADHERDRAGTARQPGGFGVEDTAATPAEPAPRCLPTARAASASTPAAGDRHFAMPERQRIRPRDLDQTGRPPCASERRGQCLRGRCAPGRRMRRASARAVRRAMARTKPPDRAPAPSRAAARACTCRSIPSARQARPTRRRGEVASTLNAASFGAGAPHPRAPAPAPRRPDSRACTRTPPTSSIDRAITCSRRS